MRISLPPPVRPAEGRAGPVWPALREGLVWLWRDRVLRRLALVLGGFNFIGSGIWAMMVLYGQRLLGLDAVGYGSFLTVVALGGLAAALVGPAILERIGTTAGVRVGMTLFVLPWLALALHPPIWAVGIVMAIEAFGGMLWNVATISYRQRRIPAALLGRVNAAYRFFGTGPAAFGAFVFGSLVSWAGPLGPVEAVLVSYQVAAAGALALWLYALVALHLS